MPTEDPKSRTELTIESILEGKKMEAYVEHRTKEMHCLHHVRRHRL